MVKVIILNFSYFIQCSPHKFPLIQSPVIILTCSMIHTHYHNSNLIWRTVSRRVDEVIPSDYPRSVSRRVDEVILSDHPRSVSRRVDEVIPSDHPRRVCPHPRDVILYARSSYYYDNMFIICLFSDILSDIKTCFGLLSRKLRERLP